MKKILWLPAWYPNKTECFTGDFIQRHARAVSLYHKVQVIHVLRDKEGKITESVKEEIFQNGNLSEKIIYYYSPAFLISFLDKIISNRRYYRLYKKAIKEYLAEDGIPVCAHIHVVNKNGLLALWLKRKYNIPFLISEHWTLYLHNAVPKFINTNILFRTMWRKIVKAADGFSSVSGYLAGAISQIHNIQSVVIPNVVDTSIFFPDHKKEDSNTRFIHISGLGYQKNPVAIIEAFAIVKQTNPKFTLSVFGPPAKELKDLSIKLGLEKQLQFYDELPQIKLSVFVQQSHALILYSRYETFGCVLIEANACGVPVIVSDLPVFHEIIEDGINGYFTPGGNPAALAEKIVWFMQNGNKETNAAVGLAAKEKYNYETVGKLFVEFYNNRLSFNS